MDTACFCIVEKILSRKFCVPIKIISKWRLYNFRLIYNRKFNSPLTTTIMLLNEIIDIFLLRYVSHFVFVFDVFRHVLMDCGQTIVATNPQNALSLNYRFNASWNSFGFINVINVSFLKCDCDGCFQKLYLHKLWNYTKIKIQDTKLYRLKSS